MDRTPTLVVMDAHPLIRQSVAHHFAGHGRARVVATFGQSAELLGYLAHQRVDAAILGCSAYAGELVSRTLIGELVSRFDCKVIVFTGSTDPTIRRGYTGGGASWVVSKTSTLDVLHAGVLALLAPGATVA